MRSPLQRSIEDNQPLYVIRDVKRDGNASYDLSLAAFRGRLDVVSWLINEGVTPPLIGSELEEQHLLVAKFLASCGVNNLVNDPIVTEGVCFRALSQKETGLLDRVLENVANPHEFIELALCQKDSTVADKLLNRSKTLRQKIRNGDAFNYTAGFWTAVNQLDFWTEDQKEAKADSKTLGKACPTPEDWILTLRQLRMAGKFNEFMSVYPKAVAWLPAIGSEVLDKPMMLTDSKLDDSLQQIFQAAASVNHELFEKNRITLEIYYALSLRAYRSKNYVALKTILDHCDKQELLKMLIIKDEKGFSLFLLVGVGFNLLQLSLDWSRESFTPKFKNLCWKNEGNFEEFVRPFADYKSMLQYEKARNINYLEQKIERLSRFTTQLNQEIGAKCCLEERFSSPIACSLGGKILFGIYVASMMVSSIFLSLGLTQAIQICAYYCRAYSYDKSKCFQTANDCVTAGWTSMMGLTMGYFVLGFLLGFATGLYTGTGTPFFKKGRERFHELPINCYSQVTQTAATGLFDDFKEMQANPFVNRNLDSKVAHVLPDAERLLIEKQAELQRWRTASDHRVEMIPEVKKEEPVPAQEDDGIPELWVHSSQLFSLRTGYQLDSKERVGLLAFNRGTS